MVIHTCISCGEMFRKKSVYVKHINRKNPCVKIKNEHIEPIKIEQTIIEQTEIEQTEIEQTIIKQQKIEPIKIETNKIVCNFCNKYFSRIFCLNRHMNICKMKNDITTIKNNNEILKNDNEILKNDNEILKNDNNALKNDSSAITQSIKNIESNLASLQNLIIENKNNTINTQNITNNKIDTQNITNNIINNNITNNTQNIILINYNDGKINKEDLELILKNGNPILFAIEKMYCNEKNPNQHTVLVTDKNRDSVQVYENKKWIVKEKKYVMINILGNIIKELEHETLNGKNDDETTINFRNEQLYYFKSMENMIKHNTRANNTFYNNRQMILDTKKINEENMIINAKKNKKNINKIK